MYTGNDKGMTLLSVLGVLVSLLLILSVTTVSVQSAIKVRNDLWEFDKVYWLARGTALRVLNELEQGQGREETNVHVYGTSRVYTRIVVSDGVWSVRISATDHKAVSRTTFSYDATHNRVLSWIDTSPS